MSTEIATATPASSFWAEKVALVLMAHNKCGLPIVRELLQLGMRVIGFTRVLRNGELLRQHLSERENELYITREMDLHSIMHIRAVIVTLQKDFPQVHLVVFLIPKIKADHLEELYHIEHANVLQAMLEIDELSVDTFTHYLRKTLLDKDSGRCWVVRFNHANGDLACRFISKQLRSADESEREISVFLSQ